MSSGETNFEFRKKELPGLLLRWGLIVFLTGLALVIASYFIDKNKMLLNSIVLFTFITSLGIGSLFLVALEYIAGAVWSTVYRRISEILAVLLFAAPLLALPSLLNLHDVFHWTHTEAVAKDPVLSGKSPYLNTTFFVVRFAAIFILSWLFYYMITRNSRKQDLSGNPALSKRNIRISAVFMPVFAISITLIAIDWLMSLEPHWFSTIFGVYYFAGTVLAALAALTYIAVILNEKGYLPKGLGPDNYYSLGALMFAFINFWAYIAFSQYLLIWYANLPEETFWFINRGQGSWLYISIGIVFIHFIIPYALLLSQPSKMDPKRLKQAAIWILFAHYYDLYWLTLPNYDKTGFVFNLSEIAFPVFGVGLVMLVFYLAGRKQNIIPLGDPKLHGSINFHL